MIRYAVKIKLPEMLKGMLSDASMIGGFLDLYIDQVRSPGK